MKTETVFKDTRLLDALDYIDCDLIAGAIDELKISDMSMSEGNSRPAWQRSVKYTLALVACLALLSLSIPLVSTLIGKLNLWAGSAGTTSDTPESTSGMYDEYILTEDDLAELNEAYFRMLISEDLAYAELSEAELNQIRESKYGKYAQTVEQAMYRPAVRPGNGGNCYIGKYGECIVVVTIPNESVALYGDRFWACYNSEFYSLHAASQNGYISDEDIERIHEFYDSLGIAEPEKICLTVQGEEILTDSQKPYNEKAKKLIAEKYGITDLSLLTLTEIDEPSQSDRNKEICYSYELETLYGYKVYTKIQVRFDETGQLAREVGGHGDDVVYFLDVLTKEMVDEAVVALEEKVGDASDKSRPYFTVDDEGCLCINVEVIEHIETTNVYGENHKHVFYKEIIIQKP